ncbi:hypothetical protein CIK05_04655 [Bdellovibrio sp. qaytius]|nr:hypothetical protein CIK05_04655 [Bdellovibrio sp. qaytius]
MSKVDFKTKKPLVTTAQKTENFPTRPSYNVPANKQNLPPAHAENSREVMPIDAQYSDLLKAKEFNFKAHILPVAAIFVFSLVLVVLFHFTNPPGKAGAGRGVSGDLNDLSNGQYQSQSADYQEEKVCVDNSDGTKTCTTKTKLHRAFR